MQTGRSIETGDGAGRSAPLDDGGVAPLVDPLEGASAAIRALRERARLARDSSATILIYGETGTGKGLLARWLHATGGRAREAFVELNCGALSPELVESELFGNEPWTPGGPAASRPGLLQVALGGTLLLDEIGEAPAPVQAILFKALQTSRFFPDPAGAAATTERSPGVRLISATRRDLGSLAAQGIFRADLYDRVATVELRIPALRERSPDIPRLAVRILAQLGRTMGRPRVELETPAIEALQSHSWPGNIRELRSVLEQTLLLSDRTVIRRRDLRLG
jgi:DNA-binding NtrC family response regulator